MRRVRIQVRGTVARPRLSVFRSNRHLFAQLIDDSHGLTLASACDAKVSRTTRRAKSTSPRERAAWVGEKLAELARARGVTTARFDRGAYAYHGLVAAVAEGARRKGLKL